MSATTGYQFFIGNADSDFYYRKSTDSGASWAAAVSIDVEVVVGFDVWFDKWTPGDTGTKIHMAWFGSTADDVWYRTLDTNGDTLGTERVVTALLSAVADSGSHCSVTKARSGLIYVTYDIDNGAETGAKSSSDEFASVNTTVSNPIEAADDLCYLYPANGSDTDDIAAIYFDVSASQVSVKYYDQSANSWAETQIGTMVSSPVLNVERGIFGASVRHSDGHIIVAFNNKTQADASSDIEVWDVQVGTGAADTVTVTQKTNIVTDVDNCTYPGAVTIRGDGRIYVGYIGTQASTETVTTDAKIYYVRSDDGGVTWSSQQAYGETGNDQVRVWSDLGGNRQSRFAPVWLATAALDIFVNAGNSVLLAQGLGTSALKLPFPVLTSIGNMRPKATSALKLPFPWITATGVHTVTTASGISALVLPFPVMTATGRKTYPGSAVLVLPFPVLTATGLLRDIAAGTLVLPFPVMAGTGLYTPPTAAGVGALTLPFPTMAGVGVMRPQGVGALVLPFPVMTASGLKVYEGISALVLPFPVLTATGTHTDIQGSAALVLPFPVMAGVGMVPALGVGALTLPFPVLTASGLQKLIATGALTLPFPVLTASGTHTDIQGTSALTLPFPTMAGVGHVPIAGSGSLVLPFPVLTATGMVYVFPLQAKPQVGAGAFFAPRPGAGAFFQPRPGAGRFDRPRPGSGSFTRPNPGSGKYHRPQRGS